MKSRRNQTWGVVRYNLTGFTGSSKASRNSFKILSSEKIKELPTILTQLIKYSFSCNYSFPLQVCVHPSPFSHAQSWAAHFVILLQHQNPSSSRVHREFRAGSSTTASNAASVTQSLLALSCFPSNININWGNPAIWLTCLTSVLIIEVPKGSYFPRTPNLWLWWLLLYKVSY